CSNLQNHNNNNSNPSVQQPLDIIGLDETEEILLQDADLDNRNEIEDLNDDI
ncbi:4219_t:CDS:2, partial [Cetraspora pellucida]